MRALFSLPRSSAYLELHTHATITDFSESEMVLFSSSGDTVA